MKQQYLEAGQIVSAHGLRGEVKVYPWADSPAFLTGLPRVSLGGQAYGVEHGRVQKSCALLKLQGVDTVEEAQRLRGKTVLVNREDVPLAPGTYFIADLIGLRVLAGDEEIGVVREVLTMPGNDAYVIQGQAEHMIPAVQEFILETNPEAGYIRVKLIEGM